MKKSWVSENQGLLIKSGLVIGGGVFVIYLLKASGIIKSQAEKKAEADKQKQIQQNATSINSPFNPNYYKNKVGGALITSANANIFSDAIYNAVGNFYDDESAIYAVFRQLKAKTQVSFLAEKFYQRYQEDLYNFLHDSLNDSEMTTINQIVNGMAEK